MTPLDIPTELTLETMQHYRQALIYQQDVALAKDQLATAKSRLADLRLRAATNAETFKEAEENIATARDKLRETYRIYKKHILPQEAEQSLPMALSLDELTLKYLELICNRLQPTITLSIAHWILLRDRRFANTSVLQECQQRFAQKSALGDRKGKLHIDQYSTYTAFSDNPLVLAASKEYLDTANQLIPGKFIRKMHQLVHTRLVNDPIAIYLALQLFREVMESEGAAALLTDDTCHSEEELIEILTLAFHLWPGIINVKMKDYPGNIIHLLLSDSHHFKAAEALVTWGCNLSLQDNGRDTLGMLDALKQSLETLNREQPRRIPTEHFEQIAQLKDLCRRKINSISPEAFKYQYVAKVRHSYPWEARDIQEKWNIREIHDYLARKIREHSTPQQQFISSSDAKGMLKTVFPDKFSEIDAIPLQDKFSNLEDLIYSIETYESAPEVRVFSDADIRKLKESQVQLTRTEREDPVATLDRVTMLNEYRITVSIEKQDYTFYIDEYFTIQVIFKFLKSQTLSLRDATLNDLSVRLGMLLEPDLQTACLVHVEVPQDETPNIRGRLIVKDPIVPKPSPETSASASAAANGSGFFRGLFSSGATTTKSPTTPASAPRDGSPPTEAKATSKK